MVIFIVLVVLFIIAMLIYIVGSYFVDYSVTRKERTGDAFNPEELSKEENPYQETIDRNSERLRDAKRMLSETAKPMKATITSYDDLKLRGWYYQNRGSRRKAILIHGYSGNHSDMESLAYQYYSWGYSVLLPDNRAHGESEGKYIGMGWLDRKDILKWMDWLMSMDPDSEIVIHGVSMGAAAVMMTAGENHPNLKAAIEDCGYTSVWDIFSDELKALFHLPSFPVMNACSAVMKMKAGYSPKEASSIRQLKKTDVPMLFIHGSKDKFVAFRMLDINYDAKIKGYKEKIVFEGAKHAQSETLDPERYYSAVRSFLEKQGL